MISCRSRANETSTDIHKHRRAPTRTQTRAPISTFDGAFRVTNVLGANSHIVHSALSFRRGSAQSGLQGQLYILQKTNHKLSALRILAVTIIRAGGSKLSGVLVYAKNWNPEPGTYRVEYWETFSVMRKITLADSDQSVFDHEVDAQFSKSVGDYEVRLVKCCPAFWAVIGGFPRTAWCFPQTAFKRNMHIVAFAFATFSATCCLDL